MYSRQEISQIRKDFWTRFGQYMRPLPGAGGDSINWLNYKTGIKHVYFRMDADTREASIAIEWRHPDQDEQREFFNKLKLMQNMLEETTGEAWTWHLLNTDEDGKPVSRVIMLLKGVNIFKQDDWPAIISFLKPRLLALDAFWYDAKDMLE